MIEVDINEAAGRLRGAVIAAEGGERVFITRNGEPAVQLVRCERTRRAGGIDFDTLRETLNRLGIEQQTPDEIAAWEKDFSDAAFSLEVLGVGDDWDPSR